MSERNRSLTVTISANICYSFRLWRNFISHHFF